MMRHEFKKRCKANKTRSYRLRLTGRIIAAIGLVAVAAGVLLGNQDRIGLRTEIWICALGFGIALVGVALHLTGKALPSKALKACGNGHPGGDFQSVKPQTRYTLENQNGKIEKFSDADIDNYLDDLFISPEQFVTLTAPVPKQNVRFVQACMQDSEVELQLGVEENGTHLLHKIGSKEECRRVFLEFYTGKFVPNYAEYQPVRFE